MRRPCILFMLLAFTVFVFAVPPTNISSVYTPIYLRVTSASDERVVKNALGNYVTFGHINASPCYRLESDTVDSFIYRSKAGLWIFTAVEANMFRDRGLLHSSTLATLPMGLKYRYISAEDGATDWSAWTPDETFSVVDVTLERTAYEVGVISSASLAAKNAGLSSPLFIAAEIGDSEVARILVSQGAKVDEVDGMLATPLLIAVQNGHVDVARMLLLAGKADANHAMIGEMTALHISSMMGSAPTVKLLIECGAVVNKAMTDGRTALHLAAEHGYLETAHALLRAGADPNESNLQGETPLFMASMNGHSDLVSALVDNGALIDQLNHKGWAPLIVAAQEGFLDIVRILVDGGGNIHVATSDGNTALAMASRKGHVEVVRLLLKHGSALNRAATNGATPLILAVQEGQINVLRLLLEAGEEVNTEGLDGATPLFSAIEQGHKDVARLLLAHGADVNKAKRNGIAPLHMATLTGDLDMVKLLIEPGKADVDQTALNGLTPLHSAAQLGHDSIVHYLLSSKADVNKPNSNGATPLHMAAQAGHYEVAATLIKFGADPNMLDAFGISPMEISNGGNHQEIMSLILDLQGMESQLHSAALERIAAEDAALQSAAIAELAAAKAVITSNESELEATVFTPDKLLKPSQAEQKVEQTMLEHVSESTDSAGSDHLRTFLFSASMAMALLVFFWGLNFALFDHPAKKSVSFVTSPDHSGDEYKEAVDRYWEERHSPIKVMSPPSSPRGAQLVTPLRSKADELPNSPIHSPVSVSSIPQGFFRHTLKKTSPTTTPERVVKSIGTSPSDLVPDKMVVDSYWDEAGSPIRVSPQKSSPTNALVYSLAKARSEDTSSFEVVAAALKTAGMGTQEE